MSYSLSEGNTIQFEILIELRLLRRPSCNFANEMYSIPRLSSRAAFDLNAYDKVINYV